MPLPVAMHDQIPEVRSATRLVREGMTLTSGDRQFSENVGTVDPNFLQVIPLPLVEGDPRTALAQPENLVISQSAARKYFGNADPIGKTLTTGRGGCDQDTVCANTTVALKVVGVMRDLPHNTQLDFDFLMPNTSLADRIDQDQKKNWLSNNNTFGYVTLAPGADPAQVSRQAQADPGSLDRHFGLHQCQNSRQPARRAQADAFPGRTPNHRPRMSG